MTNIIVCMKQVLDPEAPASTYQVDAEAKRVLQQGVPPVLNPFDENALEAALRIKDTQKSRITVLTLGRGLSKTLAVKSMAVGANHVILLDDNVFDDLDNYDTASILTAAITKIGNFDLILTGRQAADTNAGVVGSGIAEILGIPSVTLASKIELNNDKAMVERVIPDGREMVEIKLPVLVTVSNELGELRAVTIKGLMAAKKKTITTWNARKLSIQSSQMNRMKLVNVSIPHNEVSCELIEGENVEELAGNLALRLRGNGVI